MRILMKRVRIAGVGKANAKARTFSAWLDIGKICVQCPGIS